jgi:lipoprotein-anchoring transpeptidase ErfK/SrfK
MSNGASSTPATDPTLPQEFFDAVRRTNTAFQPHVLWINVEAQSVVHFVRKPSSSSDSSVTPEHGYAPARAPYRASTSRYGIGQEENSNKTPLGLHRIAEKIGADAEPGTIFKGRRPVGNTRDGQRDARITDRILWLDGLEPGLNRGGNVDSYRRYIYIHGTGNESTLGRPDTCGCTHLAATDLIPLFDILPVDTLIWISAR